MSGIKPHLSVEKPVRLVDVDGKPWSSSTAHRANESLRVNVLNWNGERLTAARFGRRFCLIL
jgi:hypothetical protein